MDIKFPTKEQLAEMFVEEDFPFLPEEFDAIEFIDVCLQALKVAIEEFPLEEYKPIEEYLGEPMPLHVEPKVLEQLNIPSVMLILDEDGVPFLYLRIFARDGTWLGEASCNLLSTTGFFAGRAWSVINELKSNGSPITEQEAKEFITRKTASMLTTAFRKIQARIEITANSFLEEVFWGWAEIWYEYHAEFNSLQGFKMKRLSFSKGREQVLKKHEEEIRGIWTDETSEKLFNLKKQLLAINYRKTYEHWREMERMLLDGKNWRRYVNAGDMSDITDDLIEDFEKGNDISGLALEHAARRAELYNVFDVKERRLEKRRKGIKDSGYSRSRLFELKSEGEELLKAREIPQSTAG